MESFAVLFADLILAIKDNDLDKTKEIVATLNEMILSDEVIESGDFLTSSDLFYLQEDNESYDYLINNLIPVDENTEKDLFNLKMQLLQRKFETNRISLNEVKEFLNNNKNNYPAKSVLSILRLAMLVKDYDLIIKIKSQLEE